MPPSQTPRRDSTSVYILRLSAFLLHFLSALFITYVTLRCGSTFVTHSYAEGRNGTGYAVLTDSTCQEDCFYDVPPSALSAQVGLEWNVFALLAAFEFISAGFALWHLDPLGPWQIVAYLWNLAGILLLAPYATHMSLLQYSITALSLLVGTAVQMYPIGREGDDIQKGHVAMHYTEYCTSASLLYLSVLILFVPAPPSWACIVGFLCVLLCNLAGVCAHLALSEQSGYASFDMNWAHLDSHFVLFLTYAWLALLVALGCIIYLGRAALTDPSVPLWVRFLLYNLLVTYSAFGIWATVAYAASWSNGRLGAGLTVLSLAAKLPVVFTVFYGLLRQPGQPLCSL